MKLVFMLTPEAPPLAGLCRVQVVELRKATQLLTWRTAIQTLSLPPAMLSSGPLSDASLGWEARKSEPK